MLYSVFTLALICYTWHLILDTWYLTPIFDMLYLTLDIWHQYLTCYYFTPNTWHLISNTSTWHVILDTWYLTPVFDMLYLTLDIWHLYLTCYHLTPDTWLMIFDTWQLTCYHLILDICFHMVLVHLTWCCDTWLDTITPDTCITLHIHDYHFDENLWNHLEGGK